MVIAVLMYAGFWVGNMSLRDTHWTQAMVNLGALVATELRTGDPAVSAADDTSIWETLATGRNRAALFSDQRLVSAVIRLTGRKNSVAERERILRCMDALLARAVRRQNDAMTGESYSKALARKWRKELERREAEIATISWRLFGKRWFVHTMYVLGVVGGVAIFVGSILGLLIWQYGGYASLAANRAPSADWSIPTSFWTTVGTVIALAVALVWLVVPALRALVPWSRRFSHGAIIVATIALALAALSLTWDFLGFDLNEWFDENRTTASPIVFAIVACVLAFLAIRYIASKRHSVPMRLVVLGLGLTFVPLPFAVALLVLENPGLVSAVGLPSVC